MPSGVGYLQLTLTRKHFQELRLRLQQRNQTSGLLRFCRMLKCFYFCIGRFQNSDKATVASSPIHDAESNLFSILKFRNVD